ncbi:MAG: hypothetical protein J5J06_05355, partial [Phycisphaerae bacterium]|nr:hypothetical protein [Phycisphaerae bacterium]
MFVIRRSRSCVVLLALLAFTVGSGASFAQTQPTVDGNLTDIANSVTDIINNGLPAFAINQVDQLESGPMPGSDGFQDEPLQDTATPQGRFMHSPVNMGNAYLIYKPDSDGNIGTAPMFADDDSWLALGINIANGDGDVVLQGDSIKLVTPPDLPGIIMVPFDADGNGNPGTIGTGAQSRWAPSEPVAGFGERNDALNMFFLTCAESVNDFQIGQPEISIFYEQIFAGPTNLQILRNGIDVGPVATNFPMSAAPANGSTTASIAARGLNGISDDDFEFLIPKVDSKFSLAFPGEDFATVTRFRLARLGLLLSSDASGDLSNEDTMFILVNLGLPELRVTKQVRCEGETVWRDSAEALPGATLEYRIEVENLGNTDLGITLEDVLSSQLCGVEPVAGSLAATLFRPGDAIGQAVNFDNAGSFVPPLNPDFFDDPLLPGEQGFLTNLDGTPTFLGVLKGFNVCDDPANPTVGDRIVITFRAAVPDNCPACSALGQVNDVVNTVTAIGDPDATDPPTIDGDEIEATDSVPVNLLCRDVSFDKMANVSTLPTTVPFTLTYTYSVRNDGELVESATIRDANLCADVVAIAGVDFAAPGVATSCPICVTPASGVTTNVAASGGTFSTMCSIQFTSVAGAQAFLAADDGRSPLQGDPQECTGGTGDPLCYTNRAELRVEGANLPEGCNQEDVYRACETVCSGCNLVVTKDVGCIGPDGMVDQYNDIEDTLPGQDLRYRIRAMNTGTPVCQVCISDTLSCGSWLKAGTLSGRIDPGNRSVPLPGFSFSGGRTCYDVSSLGCLGSGETLTVTFDVQVPGDASFAAPTPSPDCTNEVFIEGYLDAGTSPTAPPDCDDEDNAAIDVLARNVTYSKTVTTLSAAGGTIDKSNLPVVDDGSYPIRATFNYAAMNNGELTEMVTIRDDLLCSDVQGIPGLVVGPCDVCPSPPGKSGNVVPGGSLSASCRLTFNTPAALVEFLAKDDGRNPPANEPATCAGHTGECPSQPTSASCYRNRSQVSIVADGVVADCNRTDACTECAEICAGCDLTVVKEVKCADDPDSGYFPSKVALPGEELTFRFTVMSAGVPVEKLCLRDTLSCRSTWSPTPMTCTIMRAGGGSDPYPAPPVSGARTCTEVNPPLMLGDMLVCTFNVTVPANYSTVNVEPDCVNTIEVDGYVDGNTPITTPPDCMDQDNATVDVKVADIDCVEKEAEAMDADGNVYGPSDFVDIESKDSSYPITLTYRVLARNPASSSEVPLVDVKICDQGIIDAADGALADGAMLTIGACEFDNVDRCKEVASLPVGGSATAECTLVFDDADAWRNFACREAGKTGSELAACLAGDQEADGECFSNQADVSGLPDYGFEPGNPNQPCLPDNPPDGGRISDESGCNAEVCVRPPSQCTCTKATFTIWNMNEVKFSGTHRCICDWDQELISLYDAPNHMLRQYLQTNKGKARIDAIASPIVCDPFLEDAVSVDSPLLGVAAKQLTFHRPSPGVDADGIVKRDSAGMSLVGLGQQAGKITYALPTSGGPEERSAADNGIAVSRLLDGPQRLVRGSKIEPAESPLAGTTSASRLAS